MSPIAIGLVCFILIMLVILLGMHVGIALIMIGLVGLTLIIDFEPAISSVVLIAFGRVTDYNFAVVPLFLLMSAFVSRSGIGEEAYKTASVWVGQLRGGLSMATTVACGLFAACCGSSLASAVAMGQMAHPEMKRYKYNATLSVGTIAKHIEVDLAGAPVVPAGDRGDLWRHFHAYRGWRNRRFRGFSRRPVPKTTQRIGNCLEPP
jgi:TRAP-type mannitol/chloroaromatic compound transport system permease large subunit